MDLGLVETIQSLSLLCIICLSMEQDNPKIEAFHCISKRSHIYSVGTSHIVCFVRRAVHMLNKLVNIFFKSDSFDKSFKCWYHFIPTTQVAAQSFVNVTRFLPFATIILGERCPNASSESWVTTGLWFLIRHKYWLIPGSGLERDLNKLWEHATQSS